MVVMGAAMLWVGWFGFNGGSAVAADSNAAMAILVTHISAAVGALTWMSVEWIKTGKPTVVGIATGMVACHHSSCYTYNRWFPSFNPLN